MRIHHPVFLAVSISLAAARDRLPSELVKVSKAQTSRWPDGKVARILRAPPTPEMKLFLQKVYELPEAQVKDLIANGESQAQSARYRPLSSRPPLRLRIPDPE